MECDWDSDFWADHNDDCHGNREDLGDEYPEGFIYPCCDQDGTAEGCMSGRHKEEEVTRKRRRLLSSAVAYG